MKSRRSQRSLPEACDIAGISPPRTARELGDAYLQFLVLGIDHDWVGKPGWVEAMLYDAPRELAPGPRHAQGARMDGPRAVAQRSAKESTMKGKKVRLNQIDRSDQRFAPPLDERLADLMVRVANGKAPSWRTTARVADLRVHHPPTLGRVGAELREEPALHAQIVKHVLTDRQQWIVFRDEGGRLVMFDDYVRYFVAREIGRESVEVEIIGEARPPSSGSAATFPS